MTDSGNHALVFGGTGLIGWGVVNELLSGYPGSFQKVTAVTNRPLREADACWPQTSENPQLQIASGVNLLQESTQIVVDQLKHSVQEIDHVTHVFYFVFSSYNDDFEQECRLNCGMMQRVVGAVNTLCPNFKSFVYSGGARGYGIYDPSATFKPPFDEFMADNLPEHYAKTVAYPWFRQILTKAQQNRAWSWSEVCPDVVVGFSPIGSGYSLALHWAQYLSLYAFNHGIRDSEGGKRVEVPFPGNDEGFNSKFTPVSTRILGRISIYAALNQNQCGGKIINTLDDAQPTTFRELWPQITGWFGLIGVGPSSSDKVVAPSEYISEHKHIFRENGRPKGVTAGVGAGSKQLDSVGYWLSFDRQLSAARLRAVGFAEERAPIEGWFEAFDKLRSAGIIL